MFPAAFPLREKILSPGSTHFRAFPLFFEPKAGFFPQ
jgi:hypothetical protein